MAKIDWPTGTKANGSRHSSQDCKEQFRGFAESVGYPIRGDIVSDGKFHPVPGNDAARYCLRPDGVPTGSIWDWRGAARHDWKANGLKFNHEDRERFRVACEVAKAQRDADRVEINAAAAAEAERIWNEATPAREDHPYLVSKKVKPYGIREHQGDLVIPLWNDVKLVKLVGLQFIGPGGSKRFLKGSQIKGSYYAIGDIEGADKLGICEGYATGATIEEREGLPCLVSFNAGNLLPVSLAARTAFPDADITLCADDDHLRINPQTGERENIGIIKAREAALAIGAKLAEPDFARFDKHRGEKDTDFNDLDRLDREHSPALDGCWAVVGSIQNARYVEEIEAAEKARADADHFKPVQLGDLLRTPAPQRRWLVPDWIPEKQVTLLAGDGGIGKSTLALQLAAAVATGASWLGMDTRQGRVAVLSAEDDLDEMHFRFQCIVRGIEGEHEGKLQALNNVWLIDATKDLSPLLAAFDEKTKAVSQTDTFERLRAFVVGNNIDVVILDSAADVFNEELNRHGVRSFIRGIKSLADTVILLGHPSVSGMKDGRGYSGSTHWNNAVRSRLHFIRALDAESGSEPDPDLRFLNLGKSNRSRAKLKLALRWTEDGFVVDEKAASGLDDLTRRLKAEEVFMKLTKLHWDQGRRVSPNRSPSHAPSMFAKHPDNEGCSKADFERAMENLFSAGKIEVIHEGPPSRIYQRLKVAGDQSRGWGEV